MMAKPSDQPGFKKLLAEWNDRLAASGFRDVEVMEHGELVLRVPGTTQRYRTLAPVVRMAKEDYFSLVSQYVNETEFKDLVDWAIMVLHAKGKSYVDIQRTLGMRGNIRNVKRKSYYWLRIWGLK